MQQVIYNFLTHVASNSLNTWWTDQDESQGMHSTDQRSAHLLFGSSKHICDFD